jgi:enoyl-CoA hydratase
MNNSIEYQRAGPVAYVTINHPQRRNAMTYAMWCQLGDVLETLSTDAPPVVLVLSGAGDQAFCAGNDISEFGQWRTNPEKLHTYHQASHRAMGLLHQAPFPVIAKIQGACVGGGLEIALMCDFRYSSNTARFAITPAKLGLGYTFTDVQRVVAILGTNGARKLLLTGRIHNCAEALELGLVDAIFEASALDEGVDALASELSRNAPLTLKALKAALFEAGRPTAEQDQQRIQHLVDACHASEDFADGQGAFAEKRPPHFKGK